MSVFKSRLVLEAKKL